jgi:hypothetical protein
MPLPSKTWKTRPAYYVLMQILNRKGDMPETDLYNAIHDEFDDLGYKDFNDILLKLEVAGKIRTTSLSRGKKRIELVNH